MTVRGKFLYSGDRKFLIRGVTYGTFRPDPEGNEYRRAVAEQDLDRIRAHGFNTVRTYTPPPPWFMDMAWARGLRIMAGLPWQQHVAFLDSGKEVRDIALSVQRQVRGLGRHPALLCYAVGNEIPAPIVRWHGARRVQRFLKRLYDLVRDEDADALVTYVNYPSTEYLQLPFVDFTCFNIYLESARRLHDYLAHLQTVAGDKPLVIAELGVDSRRHGELLQARMLASQVEAVFANGCAGAFVFAWTDEWHRGGHDVHDWEFGLTDRNRAAKPALAAVQAAFTAAPFQRRSQSWPRVSVVVCTYNGGRTLRECLDGLMRLDYADFEIIVVDDGSTDATGRIVAEYPVRVIRTENRGLGSARNTGIAAATGEIVAFIDDDAYPDPHWLQYLAAALDVGECAGVGGPNIPPPGDGLLAAAVAAAPGGPVHVLISHQEAEHIPGCNMAFLKSCLQEVGGFDPVYRVAGDDVDICWRMKAHGLKLGFSAGAVVWHRRRSSIRAYWKQQQGYGRAEALLSARWPEKYNSWGHVRWVGRVYGAADHVVAGARRPFHGVWGTALFQSLYEPAPRVWASLLVMPEWYLVVLGVSAFAGLGTIWTPWTYVLPIPLMVGSIPLAQSILRGFRAVEESPRRAAGTLRLKLLSALLHVLQPLARLYGRMEHGLTPWRRVGRVGFLAPWPRRWEIWNESWAEHGAQLETLERVLKDSGVAVVRGGDFTPWDFEAWAGSFAGTRLYSTIEEHGAGRQMLRLRCAPRLSRSFSALTAAFGASALILLLESQWVAAVPFAAVTAWMSFRLVRDAGASVAAASKAVPQLQRVLETGFRPPPILVTAREYTARAMGRSIVSAAGRTRGTR